MRELSLLEHIYRSNAALPASVVIPPGDDMGMLHLNDPNLLVAVDQVADGVHFDLKTTSLDRIGRKAITRNLSDIAGMAANPVAAVVAGCLPKGMPDADAIALFDAMRSTAARYDCPLVGGDISAWNQGLILTVTVLASPDGIEPITRRGAGAGDVICVTGQLGGSLHEHEGYIHHLDFEPRIALARKLAGIVRPTSMIDLSDGLASDLRRLLRADLNATVDVAKLPTSAALRAITFDVAENADDAPNETQPAWWHALHDGEDYELCFTISSEDIDSLPTEIEGVPITVIGQIHAGESSRTAGEMESQRIQLIFLRMPDGQCSPLDGGGWEHRT